MNFTDLYLRRKMQKNHADMLTPPKQSQNTNKTYHKSNTFIPFTSHEQKSLQTHNPHYVNSKSNAENVNPAAFPLLSSLLDKMNSTTDAFTNTTSSKHNMEHQPHEQNNEHEKINKEKHNATLSNNDSSCGNNNKNNNSGNKWDESKKEQLKISNTTTTTTNNKNNNNQETAVSLALEHSSKEQTMEQLLEMVRHVSSAQILHEATVELTRRVGTFEEKMRNVTHVLELSCETQSRREEMLHKENTELREVVNTQAHELARMQSELVAIRECLPDIIEHAISEHMTKLQETERKRHEDEVRKWELRVGEQAKRHSEELITLRRLVGELSAEMETSRVETPAMQNKLSMMQEEGAQTRAKWEQEMTEIRNFARINLELLKKEMNQVQDDVQEIRSTYDALATTIDHQACKVDAEYSKLREILRRKVDEAGALSALMNKELQLVSEVARTHDNLSSRNNKFVNYTDRKLKTRSESKAESGAESKYAKNDFNKNLAYTTSNKLIAANNAKTFNSSNRHIFL